MGRARPGSGGWSYTVWPVAVFTMASALTAPPASLRPMMRTVSPTFTAVVSASAMWGGNRTTVPSVRRSPSTSP